MNKRASISDLLALEKTALIFGAEKPNVTDYIESHGDGILIDSPALAADRDRYIKEKAQEKPTGYLKGTLGGAALLGLPFAIGTKFSKTILPQDAVATSVVGALLGASAARFDKKEIEKNKKILLRREQRKNPVVAYGGQQPTNTEGNVSMHKRASMGDLLAVAAGGPDNRFLHNPSGDPEGEMVRNKLMRICEMADEMKDLLTDADELPPWVQDHISTSYENLDQVFSYLQPKAEKTAGPRMDAARKALSGRMGSAKDTLAKLYAKNPMAARLALGALGGGALGGLAGGDLQGALVGAALGAGGAEGGYRLPGMVDRRMNAEAIERAQAARKSYTDALKSRKGELAGLSKEDRRRAFMADHGQHAPLAGLADEYRTARKQRKLSLEQAKRMAPYAALAGGAIPAAAIPLLMRDED